VWLSTVTTAPWAAVPATGAVFNGWLLRLRPIGLSTVRGPLAWIGIDTVVDDPDAPAVVTVVVAPLVVVGATAG
jgi:hypothetical protein